MKMGADAIINLLPHVKDDPLRSLMTQQLDGYEKYAARAARVLEAQGEKPREENILTRVTARVGMAFSTLIDSTTGHLAELMIEGSNMGITEMTKLLNANGARESAEQPARLAKEIIAFEQHNIEMMKHFL
jgi:hypothetical protein